VDGRRHLLWSERHKAIYCLSKEQDQRLPLPLREMPELTLVAMLHEVKQLDEKAYNRLLTALSLFNESCRVSRCHPNSSIVLITSSFEALLNLPRKAKSETFVYSIKLLWGFQERIGDWAKELYTLRSQIVHGDMVPNEKLLVSPERHYPHFEIARTVFQWSLWFILGSYGVAQPLLEFRLKGVQEALQCIIPNREKAATILKRKKQWTYASFSKDHDKYEDFVTRMEMFNIADSSAAKLTDELVRLIFRIALDWMADDEKRFAGKADVPFKTHYDFVLSQYVKIREFIEKYKGLDRSVAMSLDESRQWDQEMLDFRENIRRIEPIFYPKDEFYFTLPEFLTRCLEPIWPLW
jgi:hypothetical protein